MANVAKSYAVAIYELDKEDKVINTLDDLKLIVKVISDNSELQKFLSHPLIHSEEKKKLLLDNFKGLNKNSIHLVSLLLDHNCISILEDIIKEYQFLLDEEHNIIHVEVITASKLASDDKIKLSKELEKYLHKNIILEEIVDKKNLGGIIVKYQGKILNASLLQKQEDLKEFLLK